MSLYTRGRSKSWTTLRTDAKAIGYFLNLKNCSTKPMLRRRSLHIHLLRKHLNMMQQRKRPPKFRIVALVVRFCISQVKRHSLRTQQDDELSLFIKQVHFHEHHPAADVDLMFDPTLYKVKRQNRMSEEMIRIWSKQPESRTEHECYTVQIGARNMPSFKEFPARMQRLIAEVGIYSKYEAKRVLVRQGNPAEYFYFILSGTVVVMVMDDERKYARPVAYLYKGQSFGELAIINRTSRQSTVIAKETCELLRISVSDYHKIFMAGGVRNIQDPDYKDFIGHLSFLQDWPVEKLQEQPTKCLFLYFKRGDVLVKDSQYSDWVIVVKSGSVSVLKKLKKVVAFKWKTERDIKVEYDKDIRRRRKMQFKDLQILPDVHTKLRSEMKSTENNHTRTLKPLQHSKPNIPKEHILEQKDSNRLKFGKRTNKKHRSLTVGNPVANHQGSWSNKSAIPMDGVHETLSHDYGKPMEPRDTVLPNYSRPMESHETFSHNYGRPMEPHETLLLNYGKPMESNETLPHGIGKPMDNHYGSLSYKFGKPMDIHHGSLSYTFGKPMDIHHGSLSYKFGKPMDIHHGSLSRNVAAIHVDAERRPESQDSCGLPPIISARGSPSGRQGGGCEMKPVNCLSRNRLGHIEESSGDVFGIDQTTARLDKRRQSELEREKEMMGFTQHVRTISEDLDAGIKRKDIDDVTPADLNPEFVKVQTLTKGQMFGLADVILGEQTSFCVISNGADCFFINKLFYKKHMSEKLFRRMRHELCPYPSERELQEKLQVSINWEAYRGRTLQSALERVKLRKQIRLLT